MLILYSRYPICNSSLPRASPKLAAPIRPGLVKRLTPQTPFPVRSPQYSMILSKSFLLQGLDILGSNSFGLSPSVLEFKFKNSGQSSRVRARISSLAVVNMVFLWVKFLGIEGISYGLSEPDLWNPVEDKFLSILPFGYIKVLNFWKIFQNIPNKVNLTGLSPGLFFQSRGTL